MGTVNVSGSALLRSSGAAAEQAPGLHCRGGPTSSPVYNLPLFSQYQAPSSRPSACNSPAIGSPSPSKQPGNREAMIPLSSASSG